jgi:hypothetical protein
MSTEILSHVPHVRATKASVKIFILFLAPTELWRESERNNFISMAKWNCGTKKLICRLNDEALRENGSKLDSASSSPQ